ADLVHAHQVNVYAFASALAVNGQRRPLVLTAYGSDIQSAPDQSRLIRWLVRWTLRRASRIISESRSLIDEIDRLEPGARHRTRRIPFPLPGVTTRPVKEALAYSNRLHEPNYRIDRVLRGLVVLRAQGGIDLRAVIAGEGSETPRLRRLATELGLDPWVEFVGWVDAARNEEYYGRAAYFFSLPEKDAYSISLQEAMQWGCLPIVSDIACNRELVLHGTNGVLLDIDGGGLEALTALDLEAVRRLNRDLIHRSTAAELCLPAFLRVYREALGLSP
ncbi:MAG: glycosyltransferase family 4 protein, partial [Gemmatimonadota bacterium]